jgi:hypothetical protein
MHVKTEFPISSAMSDADVHWAARAHAAAARLIEAIPPSHRAERGQQRSPNEITEDCRPLRGRATF